MKKLLSLTLCMMFAVLTFASSVYATTYNYDSFTDGNGYGSKTKVDESITNLKGQWDESMGMMVGPFSKASNAKLADGINEKTYVEINPEELKHGEHFEVSLALKNADNEYVSEAVVMTQKVDGTGVVLTAGWAPDFKAIVDEEGVYTYQWEMTTKDEKTFVKFTVLNYDDVIGTTGEIDFDSITTDDTKTPIADQEDVSVKYLWFCGISVADGINVYAELPKSEDIPPVEDNKEEKPSVKDNEEENPVVEDAKEEKDETPKTGSIDVITYVGAVVAVITLAGIVTVKKYNK